MFYKENVTFSKIKQERYKTLKPETIAWIKLLEPLVKALIKWIEKDSTYEFCNFCGRQLDEHNK